MLLVVAVSTWIKSIETHSTLQLQQAFPHFCCIVVADSGEISRPWSWSQDWSLENMRSQSWSWKSTLSCGLNLGLGVVNSKFTGCRMQRFTYFLLHLFRKSSALFIVLIT